MKKLIATTHKYDIILFITILKKIIVRMIIKKVAHNIILQQIRATH